MAEKDSRRNFQKIADFLVQRSVVWSCSLAFSLTLLTFPSDALSAYRIVLRNGSSIIVESYKKIDHRIQFFKSGGVIDIDSADIVEIKEIRSTAGDELTVRDEEPQSTDEVAVTGGEVTAPGAESEEEIRLRLEEIQKEKEALKKEADTVTEDIEKLNQEIRREGRVLAIRKKRELEKRKEELEKSVKELNTRIEELNKEEDELLRKLWKY